MPFTPESVFPPSDNERGKKDMNKNRAEQFKALNSYAADLAGHRDVVPPQVTYDPTAPKCKACNQYFQYDSDERRFYCPCPHSIRESEIEFSPFNANAEFKTLEERVAESNKQRLLQQQQQQQQSQTNTNSNNADPNLMPRIVTERGATSDGNNIGYGSAGATGTGSDANNHSFLKAIDPRENLLRERRGYYYSDHSRTNIREQPTNISPLDKELTDLGYQIREVFEVSRQPNSPDVSRNLPVDQRGPKPYARYNEKDDGSPDVYDKV